MSLHAGKAEASDSAVSCCAAGASACTTCNPGLYSNESGALHRRRASSASASSQCSVLEIIERDIRLLSDQEWTCTAVGVDARLCRCYKLPRLLCRIDCIVSRCGLDVVESGTGHNSLAVLSIQTSTLLEAMRATKACVHVRLPLIA